MEGQCDMRNRKVLTWSVRGWIRETNLRRRGSIDIPSVRAEKDWKRVYSERVFWKGLVKQVLKYEIERGNGKKRIRQGKKATTIICREQSNLV